MKKLLIAGAAVFALAGAANAGQPVTLTDAQMDHVSAGATALAAAQGIFFADLGATSMSSTSTLADAIHHIAASAAANTTAATSSFFQAFAQSQSASSAALP
jgi:hypothetical protein